MLKVALLMKRYILVQHRYQEREEDSEDELVPPAARSNGVGQLEVVCVPKHDHDVRCSASRLRGRRLPLVHGELIAL